MQKIYYISRFHFELQNSCLKNFIIKFIFFSKDLTGLFITIFSANTRRGGTIFKFFLSLFYNILCICIRIRGQIILKGSEGGRRKNEGKGTVDRIVLLWKMRQRISLPGKSHFLSSRAAPPVYPASSSIISILACLRCVVLQQRRDASNLRFYYQLTR